MDVTVAQAQNLTSPAPGSAAEAAPLGFVQRVQSLPMQRKLMLGGGIAALLAILVAMAMWSN